MLCQFTFKNFKSYKNEVTLNLQATKAIGFNESLLQSANDKEKFLPVSVIYGPNAGGKSNVLEALKCVILLVAAPVRVIKDDIWESMNCKWSPFCFDNNSRNEPTEFELYFQPNTEYEYRYTIKVLNSKIVEESLYRRKTKTNSRITTVFERDSNKIELGACIKKNNINTDVNEHMPYLSFLAINYKLDAINQAVDWIRNCIVISYADSEAENNFAIDFNDEFKKKLICFMNDIGINISDFTFVDKFSRSSRDRNYDVIFEHTVSGNSYKLFIEQESDGTKKLFSVLPFIMIALSEGRLVILDELDAKLHPKLLKFLVMLFKNPEINTKNAQLLFTSHDVSTMKSSVFRTDEIWFACKLADESSELYSLADIRDENNNHIQPSAAFDKQYLEGRYGADPYFQSMMDWK